EAVRLVHRTVGFDPQVVFQPQRAAHQPGGPVVAGARVDAVDPDHQPPRPNRSSAPRITTIATACASTRARISFWLSTGLPPRNMFHSPMNRMIATAASASTVTM